MGAQSFGLCDRYQRDDNVRARAGVGLHLVRDQQLCPSRCSLSCTMIHGHGRAPNCGVFCFFVFFVAHGILAVLTSKPPQKGVVPSLRGYKETPAVF